MLAELTWCLWPSQIKSTDKVRSVNAVEFYDAAMVRATYFEKQSQRGKSEEVLS